jgi:hypothetical protein
MHPINFPGAKYVGKPENVKDEHCFGMPAMPVEYPYTGEDGKQYQGRMWVEMWQPSREDIEAINAGRPIILQIHSFALPPVAAFTLDENGNSNDAG